MGGILCPLLPGWTGGVPLTVAEHEKVRDLSGKWVQEVDKSESTKAEVTTMIIEHEGNVFRWTATIGSRVAQSFEGALDGNPHPVLQNGIRMAEIAYTPVEPGTVKSVSTLPNGKKVTATHTLSADGKTIRTRDETGGVSVWHKQ
jgi:hypothetical protein